MRMDSDMVTLSTLKGGACVELFQRELEAVLANIADLNTDHKVKRKITLEVVFTSDEERTSSAVGVKCSAKLAPAKQTASVLYHGIRRGKRIAVESNPSQSDLFGKAPSATELAGSPAQGEG